MLAKRKNIIWLARSQRFLQKCLLLSSRLSKTSKAIFYFLLSSSLRCEIINMKISNIALSLPSQRQNARVQNPRKVGKLENKWPFIKVIFSCKVDWNDTARHLYIITLSVMLVKVTPRRTWQKNHKRYSVGPALSVSFLLTTGGAIFYCKQRLYCVM